MKAEDETGAHPTLYEFQTWLEEFPDNQRVLLAAIREQWMARLAQEAPISVALLIRKAIKSRKLEAEREALLDQITALFED